MRIDQCGADGFAACAGALGLIAGPAGLGAAGMMQHAARIFLRYPSRRQIPMPLQVLLNSVRTWRKRAEFLRPPK
jgi:hypothetical protein